MNRHRWITFVAVLFAASLVFAADKPAGDRIRRLLYVTAPDGAGGSRNRPGIYVFDARTKKLVATLKDDRGRPVASSKFIEVHFKGRVPIRMGDQFGIGRCKTPPRFAAAADRSKADK